MERESGGLEPRVQNVSSSKLQTALRVMRMFLFGIFITSFIGSELASMRFPHSNWRIVPLLVLVIMIILNLLRKDNTNVSLVSGCLLPPLFVGCFVGLFFLRAHDWMPIAAGVLFAIFFWVLSKSTKRPYLFLSVGSLLAGVLSLQFPWPNEQRCLLTLVGVGLTATLQGIWIIILYLQGDRPAEFSEAADAPKKSFIKEDLRFLDFITGTIGHVQIISPELEQRIRLRYRSEIYQLTVLGFDYQFSDGETVSIFRLALIFPALVMLMMWRKREIITIRDGRYFLVGHPVYVSKDKTSFAEPCGLGTKFYTAFQDGMILISKDYGESIGLRPIVFENTCTGSSITDTWFSHQKRIEALEAEGKRVDRQTSFEFYSEIERKETALK